MTEHRRSLDEQMCFDQLLVYYRRWCGRKGCDERTSYVCSSVERKGSPHEKENSQAQQQTQQTDQEHEAPPAQAPSRD